MELSLELMLFNKKTIQYNFSLGIFFEESQITKKSHFIKKITLMTEKNLLDGKRSILSVLNLPLLAKL